MNCISIIEFGVAGGNGLLAMQFHAREIARIVGIEIQVYGFDTGSGLPVTDTNEMDLPFYWDQGFYKMDYSNLKDKLYLAELVIGDVKDTIPTFFSAYNPATIGVIAFDVDLYTSTIPILNMIENFDCELFLPRTYIYFDDIMGGYEELGEGRAIIEFNERNRDRIWISGEGKDDGTMWYLNVDCMERPRQVDANIKIAHFFENKRYKKFIGGKHYLNPIYSFASTL